MRPDMSKVLVERPRIGHHTRSYADIRNRSGRNHQPRQRLFDLDDYGTSLEPMEFLPRQQGIRRPHKEVREYKYLNENLSPLKRFLRSRVGQRWDDVYSEISEHLRADNPVQQHVRDHLEDFVLIHADLDEKGLPRERTDNRFRRRFRIWHLFYVHPENGLLLEVPKEASLRNWRKDHRQRQDAEKAEAASKSLVLGPERELRKLNGIWYWCVFADVPAPYTQKVWVEGRPVERTITPHGTDVFTGERVSIDRFRAAKRQASREDLRRNGLENDPIISSPIISREGGPAARKA